jgi:hypothetical protein
LGGFLAASAVFARGRKERVVPKGFLPNADGALLAWSKSFSSQINATPELFGLTPEAAAQFADLYASYAAAMALCSPTIRSMSSVAAKNTVRMALRQSASRLSSIIKGQANVTDAQRAELGLNVRAKQTVTPRPESPPLLSVDSVRGWTVRIRLSDSMAVRRGRPPAAHGAAIFSFVGTEPASDLTQWTFLGNTGRTSLDVTFSSTVPGGSAVWISAYWFNARKQSGPPCAPVGTNLQGGGVSMAALMKAA